MTIFLGLPINLPYYLVQRLTKMSSAIKKGSKNIGRSLFHHGLVRMLVEKELSKRNQSWDDFLEQNGFMAFCHCQFDCAEECVRHQEPCQFLTSPVHEPMSNLDDCVSPCVRDDLAPTPVCSPSTPMNSKRRRKSLNLSPVTPNHNDNTHKQASKKPNVRVTDRFTRSMGAKVSAVKSSMSNNIDVEIVVLDDEEDKPVSHDGPDMGTEPVIHHADNSPHIFDTNPQVDPVVDPPIKGKSFEVNLPGSYRIDEVMHPLFVNCLLDKIHRMEEEVT